MTQQEAYGEFYPLLQSSGKIYNKSSLVYVYRAFVGEYIETWTADGLETTNYASDGDFVVQNIQTSYQEKYIVPEDMFFKRYKFFYYHEKGAIYMPIGSVLATKYHGEDLCFVAKWGRLMSLKTGDIIASPMPDCKEVYRIASQEFYESYGDLL